MKDDKKAYKIIIQYTESGPGTKKYKIEYSVNAHNRSEAIEEAEKSFNTYSQSNSASWVRILDPSAIRCWRVFPQDPNTPKFIDELIDKLPCDTKEDTINILKRLGDLEDAAASSKIISLTKSDNNDIVVNAVEALGKIGDPTIFFAVKNLYFQKKDPGIKLAIVNNLLKIALPDDNITGFYLSAIKDPNTREVVFNMTDARLIPVWLPEISNEKEFDRVKKATLKLGDKALEALAELNTNHPQIFSYASQLVKLLEPKALEGNWKDWEKAVKKYKLL
ncbi:MAG: HEAT repeat domain-containing protein [Candidatus Riflebacteria bacterium]|nr:HEAT repeat domain-containing protein [Candidatus Riflebacteria bacterium]